MQISKSAWEAMMLCRLSLPANILQSRQVKQLPYVVLADLDGNATTVTQPLAPGATTISNVTHGDVQHEPAHQSRKSARRPNRTRGRHRAGLGRRGLRGLRGQSSATARTYDRRARHTPGTMKRSQTETSRTSFDSRRNLGSGGANLICLLDICDCNIPPFDGPRTRLAIR
jgi:hypothetical protein